MYYDRISDYILYYSRKSNKSQNNVTFKKIDKFIYINLCKVI